MGAGGFHNVYRWHQSDTGRYTRSDPLGKVRRTFDQGWLLVRQEPLYGYARLNPITYLDPLGLASIDRSLCIAKWTAVGAGAGAVAGGVAAGAAAGTACTFVAPGVGTIGCGAGGGAAGAAGGAALGGLFGAFFGSLLCPDDCKIDRDREKRRRTHEHCLRLYEICVSTPGRHKFEQGKRCQDCFGICRREGAWPFDLCRLNYYPHGV